jgi:hypothetical protein
MFHRTQHEVEARDLTFSREGGFDRLQHDLQLPGRCRWGRGFGCAVASGEKGERKHEEEAFRHLGRTGVPPETFAGS